jgi:hypothetical protein
MKKENFTCACVCIEYAKLNYDIEGAYGFPMTCNLHIDQFTKKEPDHHNDFPRPS